MPAGGTARVRNGTYAAFSITRSGTEGNPITIEAYPGEAPVVAGDASRSTVITISAAHDVVIRGLSIINAPVQWGAGIRVDKGSTRILIEANSFTNNRSYGLLLVDSTAITVRGNDISKNETGMQISNSGSGDLIEGNDIHDNDRMIVNTVGGNDDRGANGIVFYKSTGSITVRNNRIFNNRAVSSDYGYDGGAFEIYAASNITMTDNTMWNNENVLETGTDGTLGCSNSLFTRNIASSRGRTGPSMGMILRCAAGMLVANNTFVGLDSFVFDVTANATSFGGSIDGLRIENNIALSNGVKVYSIDSALPASVVIDHGVSLNTAGSSIAYVWGKGNTTSLATFTSWTGLERAGTQADPQFVDPAAGNYALRPTSPAVDRGTVIPGVTDGYAASGPDIGALESRP